VTDAATYFDAAYFEWQGDSAERSARAIVPLVVDRFTPASVVDVGCGSGGWLKVFREHGVADVLGIDGPYVDPIALRVHAHEFVGHDLERPLEIDRTFDVAISLEAAHYISRENAYALVASITALAPVVLFGAAVPHQPGGPGRNLQWPGWWAELFAQHGYGARDWLRPLVWDDPNVDWWYAQNTILFERGVEGEPIRSLVHPGLLEEVTAAPAPVAKRRLFRRG
jgi:SAM-dependent methyltransferase